MYGNRTYVLLLPSRWKSRNKLHFLSTRSGCIWGYFCKASYRLACIRWSRSSRHSVTEMWLLGQLPVAVVVYVALLSRDTLSPKLELGQVMISRHLLIKTLFFPWLVNLSIFALLTTKSIISSSVQQRRSRNSNPISY